jgi:DNA damage-binding protein 1
LLEIPANAQISSVTRLVHSSGKDVLLVLTEARSLFTIFYNQSAKITSETKLALYKRNSDIPGKVIVSTCQKAGLACIQNGLYTLFFMEDGKIIESHENCTKGEYLIDMKFFKNSLNVAFLLKIKENEFKLKIFEVFFNEKRPVEKKIINVDSQPFKIISINFDTCCVFCKKGVMKYSLAQNRIVKKSYYLEEVTAACEAENLNWIVSDKKFLYLVNFEEDLECQVLGPCSSCCNLTYLGNKYFFLSSKVNDPKYIRVLDNLQQDSYIEVIQSLPNIAPIIDFKINEEVNLRVLNMIACCGCEETGGIRLISKGVTVNIELEQSIANIQGIWTLQLESEYDSWLFMSFPSTTKIFEISSFDINVRDFSEASSFNHPSLLVMHHKGQIVQVTSSGIYIYNKFFSLVTSLEVLSEEIVSVAFNGESSLVTVLNTQVLSVYSLNFTSNSLKISEQSKLSLTSDISCLYSYQDYLCLSHWQACDLQVLSLSSLQIIFQEASKFTAPVKSMKMVELNSRKTLILGLRDGFLIFYQVRPGEEFIKESSFKIGYQGIRLDVMRTQESLYIFAACDRPVILYYENEQFHLTNTNIKEVSYFSSFHTESFPFSLALSVKNKFFIVSLPQLQEYSFQTYIKKFTVRRLVVFRELIIALVVDPQSLDSVRVFDNDKNEIDKLEMSPGETPICIQDWNSSVFIGASVKDLATGSSKLSGKVQVISIESLSQNRNSKLELLSTRFFEFAVYSFALTGCYLFIGFEREIRCYRLTDDYNFEDLNIRRKIKICLLLDVHNFVLAAASMIKTVDLYEFRPEQGSLELRFKNYKISCPTALKLVSAEVLVVAESNGVISVLKVNHSSKILDVVSGFCIGMEVVNAFRTNSIPTRSGKDLNIIFATTKGRIGVIFNLDEQKFKILKELEELIVLDQRDKSFTETMSPWETPPLIFVKGDVVEMFLDYPPEKRTCLALEISKKIEKSVAAADIHDILLDMVKLP